MKYNYLIGRDVDIFVSYWTIKVPITSSSPPTRIRAAVDLPLVQRMSRDQTAKPQYVQYPTHCWFPNVFHFNFQIHNYNTGLVKHPPHTPFL